MNENDVCRARQVNVNRSGKRRPPLNLCQKYIVRTSALFFPKKSVGIELRASEFYYPDKLRDNEL